jgi:DNA-binding MarR family transcriptional regulator
MFMGRSTEAFMRFLKDQDLNAAQYGALMRLYHHGNCTVSDIGTQFGITAPAASQLVDKLVHEGLVERTESAQDRRVKHLALTSQGRRLVDASLEARLEWTRALGQVLPPDRRETIAQALADLIAAAQSLEAPAPAPAVTKS